MCGGWKIRTLDRRLFQKHVPARGAEKHALEGLGFVRQHLIEKEESVSPVWAISRRNVLNGKGPYRGGDEPQAHRVWVLDVSFRLFILGEASRV